MRMTSSSSGSASDRFSIVKRGYSPQEVGEAIGRLERDVRAAEHDRASAAEQLESLTAELRDAQSALSAARIDLASARTDVDTLRTELDHAATQPLAMSSLSARMQRLVKIAEEESAELRASADRYSADTRQRADMESAQARRAADTEITQRRADAVAELTALRTETEAEVARARAEIDANRDELEQTRAAIYDQAKRLMSEAHSTAESTLAEARERADHLSAQAAADRAKQDEDYELAIDARRRQAHRAIAEAEQTSSADAAHRIDQANTHARTIVESANAHVEDLLRRAASESHQRVAEADEAVRKLISLRSQLQQQILDLAGRMADLTDTMTTVRKTLEPLAVESQRPSPDSFPAAIESGSSAVLSSTVPQWHPPTSPATVSWEKVSAQLGAAAPETVPATADPADEVTTDGDDVDSDDGTETVDAARDADAADDADRTDGATVDAAPAQA